MEIQIDVEAQLNNLLNTFYRNIIAAAKTSQPTDWTLDELYKVAYWRLYYWKYK